jgi:hypothetical protein
MAVTVLTLVLVWWNVIAQKAGLAMIVPKSMTVLMSYVTLDLAWMVMLLLHVSVQLDLPEKIV